MSPDPERPGAGAHHVDVDALAESLLRHGARAFEADWASLLDSIGAKADKLTAA